MPVCGLSFGFIVREDVVEAKGTMVAETVHDPDHEDQEQVDDAHACDEQDEALHKGVEHDDSKYRETVGLRRCAPAAKARQSQGRRAGMAARCCEAVCVSRRSAEDRHAVFESEVRMQNASQEGEIAEDRARPEKHGAGVGVEDGNDDGLRFGARALRNVGISGRRSHRIASQVAMLRSQERARVVAGM